MQAIAPRPSWTPPGTMEEYASTASGVFAPALGVDVGDYRAMRAREEELEAEDHMTPPGETRPADGFEAILRDTMAESRSAR
jgi:hypothetical protein